MDPPLLPHLKYSRASQCSCGVTNLHPRMQPNQGRELTFFINAFVRNIKEHSACERKKYPDHYNPPPNDEIILDERTAKRIAPTIRRVKINLHWENPRRDSEVIEDRTVKLFLTEYRHTPCYQFLKGIFPAAGVLESTGRCDAAALWGDGDHPAGLCASGCGDRGLVGCEGVSVCKLSIFTCSVGHLWC
jgi:hypothetical protein